MDPRSLQLWHPRKEQHKGGKLWVQKEQKVRLYALKILHCPYAKCKGHTWYTMANMKNYIILNGKDYSFRVWKGPWDRDSSNEEWKAEFRRPID